MLSKDVKSIDLVYQEFVIQKLEYVVNEKNSFDFKNTRPMFWINVLLTN